MLFSKQRKVVFITKKSHTTKKGEYYITKKFTFKATKSRSQKMEKS